MIASTCGFQPTCETEDCLILRMSSILFFAGSSRMCAESEFIFTSYNIGVLKRASLGSNLLMLKIIICNLLSLACLR